MPIDDSLVDKLKIWAFPLLLSSLGILLTRQINEAANEIKETRKDIV
jgi:hypothetical protein